MAFLRRLQIQTSKRFTSRTGSKNITQLPTLILHGTVYVPRTKFIHASTVEKVLFLTPASFITSTHRSVAPSKGNKDHAAAIGIGVTLAVVALLVGAAFVLHRRRKNYHNLH